MSFSSCRRGQVGCYREWFSEVCSRKLGEQLGHRQPIQIVEPRGRGGRGGRGDDGGGGRVRETRAERGRAERGRAERREIGRASCRERVEDSVVGGAGEKKKTKQEVTSE